MSLGPANCKMVVVYEHPFDIKFYWEIVQWFLSFLFSFLSSHFSTGYIEKSILFPAFHRLFITNFLGEKNSMEQV